MWLIFSYTIPAKNSNARVKVWRRLLAVGAVQLKTSLYVLPASPENHEHFQWLAREMEELGWEAVFFQCPAVENLTDPKIKALFAKQRDEDYSRLNKEIRTFNKTLEAGAQRQEEKARELRAALKRFTRRFQAIQEIDFFPSGQAEQSAMLLDSLSEQLKVLRGEGATPRSWEVLRKEDYQGKTWVTRERPYIDRLASFWLVRRFVDGDAQIGFISPKQEIKRQPELVYFDLAGGEFTHRERLITFEVLAASFGLRGPGLSRLAALVRTIDLKEDLERTEEAKILKDLVDGLVKITPDDHELVERALLVFDALYAAYKGETP